MLDGFVCVCVCLKSRYLPCASVCLPLIVTGIPLISKCLYLSVPFTHSPVSSTVGERELRLWGSQPRPENEELCRARSVTQVAAGG